MIDNIICETFNSYIRKGREKSLIDMLDYIRENLMEMMEKQIGQRNICPIIRKKLESIRNQTRHCIVKHVVGERFQVTMFRKQKTVDLMAHECSCRWWTLTGIMFEVVMSLCFPKG